MLPQFFQLLIAYGRRGPRNLVGKMNDCFVLLVEEFAAVVKREGLDLFVGNAYPLRRSGVRLGSILAAIHDRGF